MHKKYKLNTFYCFSPGVMLATVAIELAGMLYVLFMHRATMVGKLIAAILGFLALFQVAEFMICEGALGISSVGWARIGFGAITMLPPLGLHLGMTIAGKKSKPVLAAAYGSALTFAFLFFALGHGLTGQICGGNYVIFEVTRPMMIPYGLYYYGWVLVGMLFAWKYGNSQDISDNNRSALRWLAIGYASFVIPTTIVALLKPETRSGIPSIMCGFAVFLAITLLVWVLPKALNTAPQKTNIQKVKQ